jgi:hypothetical protein
MNNLTLLKNLTRQRIIVCYAACLLMLAVAAGAHAQSQDVSYPTPASTNEISGRITARDIGDARLTRHFYILAGTPGDLIFTVTSNNLNGDVDLFTAGSLRPLGKISMYAGSSPTSAEKTIFLKQRESLILRVEARSPNDNEGTYSIRFAGTFEPVLTAPASSGESATDQTPTTSDRSDRSVHRVTSAGARIDEPEPEPETTARTETTPAPTNPEPGGETPAPVEPATKPETPARTTRTRRPAAGRRRTRANPPRPSPGEETATETPSNDTTTTTAPAETALASPRLIIETRDGMRTERFMSTVRSLTVQNGQIVIVSSDGRKTERISLAAILKMSIEP